MKLKKLVEDYIKDVSDLITKRDMQTLREFAKSEDGKIPCCGHRCCCNLPEEFRKTNAN